MENIDSIKVKLKESLKIIKMYKWLVDAYVLVSNIWMFSFISIEYHSMHYGFFFVGILC